MMNEAGFGGGIAAHVYMAPDGVSGGSSAAAAASAVPSSSEKKEKRSAIKVIAKASCGGWLAAIIIFVVAAAVIAGLLWQSSTREQISELTDLQEVVAGNEEAILIETDSITKTADAVVVKAPEVKPEMTAVKAAVDKIEKKAAETTKAVEKTAEVVKEKIEEKTSDPEVASTSVPTVASTTTAAASTVTAPVYTAKVARGASVSTPSVFSTPVPEIKNNLDKVLYVAAYGDWDGAMIVKLEPGEAIKQGFAFANGKTFRPGVHFSLFSLDNQNKVYDLNDIFRYDEKTAAWRPASTSKATYYWCSGSITVRDGYYKSAMSILASDGKFYDGIAVKRSNGTTREVRSGSVIIPALNM